MKSKRRRRRMAQKTVGAAPGVLHIDPESPRPVVHVIAYGPEGLHEETVTDVSSLGPILEKFPVTWVNVDGLGDAAALTTIGEVFHMHPLALADVVNVPQRPKVEPYGRDLFIVTRMVTMAERLETEQLSLFLGKGLVLTFQEHAGDCLDPVRDRIRKGIGRLRSSPADFLAYAILDVVIDSYFPLLEAYGERLEALEDEVIARPEPAAVARIHRAKRELLTLRRAVWPQREAVNALLREGLEIIGDQTRIYLRDCYDHIIQVIDMVETYRELASGLLEAYLSSLSNRMNEVMKVLTIIATIFIPLGFLAGLYGMNFDPDKSPYNMPELGWRYGYPAALLVMAVAALGMLAFFWRKGWLGSSTAVPKLDEADPPENR
ncbi:MAG TPA: magnesium/cobalt transporter CorA [Phycisphaerae bacterium]|nr:magnesium/cobalt transporter CorA [Phycisphaerae bacterium]